jgi:kinesin family protein 1
MYQHQNELEEEGVISLTGVKVEASPEMATLLAVSAHVRVHILCLTHSNNPFYQKLHTFTLFTSSNSHVFAAPNDKEMHAWINSLDPTRLPH